MIDDGTNGSVELAFQHFEGVVDLEVGQMVLYVHIEPILVGAGGVLAGAAAHLVVVAWLIVEDLCQKDVTSVVRCRKPQSIKGRWGTGSL